MTGENDNRICNSNLEKVPLFAEHFRDTYLETNNLEFDDTQYEEVNNWYETYFFKNPVPDLKVIEEESSR